MTKEAGISFLCQHEISQQISQFSKHKTPATYRISHVLITVTLFITTPQPFFFLGTCKTGVCALNTQGDFVIFHFLLDVGRTLKEFKIQHSFFFFEIC